jgi:hypothetical protein
MVSEFDTCPFCNKNIEPGTCLCPFCGMNLTMVKQEAKEVEDDWGTGKSAFKEAMRDSCIVGEEVYRISKQRNLQIFEKRKRFVENVISQFPEIKRKLTEDHSIRFFAYIIEFPHESEEGKFVHDCVLSRLSRHFQGLISLAIGGKKLPIYQGLHVYDLPIFASRPYGDVLLSRQREIINSQLPEAQRDFLVRAEPWSVCDKIYKYPGRWVNWKLIFDVRNLEKWISEHDDLQAPLLAHKLSDFEFSSQFPIAGTRDEKEVMFYIVNESEEKEMKEIRRFFKERYGSKFNDMPDKFTVSYSTLEELGLLQNSIYKTLVEQEEFLFMHNLEKQVEPLLKKEVAKLGYNISIQSEKESEKIKKDLVDMLIEKYTRTWYKAEQIAPTEV